MMPAAETIRLAPTITATGVMVDTCTVGSPARSSSRVIAAPQRVLVPQVEVRTPMARAGAQRGADAPRRVDLLVQLADRARLLELAGHVDGDQPVRVLLDPGRVVPAMRVVVLRGSDAPLG